MYRVTFEEKSIKIWENKAPAGWIPIWDLKLEAFSLGEIGKELFHSLPEDYRDTISWFFEDLEWFFEDLENEENEENEENLPE